MEIPDRSFFGLIQYEIKLRDKSISSKIWMISAKNPTQAWSKFLAQYVPKCEMLPNRSDYSVRKK